MRNYELLDSLESYLLAEKEYNENPTTETFQSLRKKRMLLEVVVGVESTTEDIKEIFSDLRDYWETLKK